MKTKTFLYVISLVVTLTLFTTCKKYPQGSWSNVAMKHLFGGCKKGSSKVWHLKLYEVNGVDSTKFIVAGNGYTNFENGDVTFSVGSGTEAEARSIVYGYGISFSESANNPKVKRNIQFIGGSRNVNYKIQSYNNTFERNVFNPQIEKPYLVWTINKLKKDELIIKSNFENISYKIILTN
jgi:hypothetical protein